MNLRAAHVERLFFNIIMIKFIVSEKENNKPLDRVLKERYPEISRSTLFKLLRKKDVRINGVKTGEIYQVSTGDEIMAYYDVPVHFRVILETKDILAVSKDQGIPVMSDKNGEISLIDQVQKKYGNSCRLCHRIDRNTGGLVIIAKNSETEKTLLEYFKEGKVEKFYYCIVKGKMPAKSQMLTAWHFKDNKKSIVYIYDEKRTGTKEIKTGYTVEKYDPVKDVSYLKVQLFTGRTHQIRAHMAHIGHPVVGDGKYGTLDTKEGLGLKFQALWSGEIKTDLFEVKDPPAYK